MVFWIDGRLWEVVARGGSTVFPLRIFMSKDWQQANVQISCFGKLCQCRWVFKCVLDKKISHNFPTSAPTTPTPVQFVNMASFDNGNYNVSWMFNSSMNTLHFTVEVRATGWVGFGVATQAPNNMTYYDVAVGGVVNGSGYLTVN